MKDILIRDVADDVAKSLDDRAARLGLSRNEMLRRLLGQEAQRERAQTHGPTTAADWERFADTFQDLGDPEIMQGAWR